jgi:hypothetical protein
MGDVVESSKEGVDDEVGVHIARNITFKRTGIVDCIDN